MPTLLFRLILCAFCLLLLSAGSLPAQVIDYSTNIKVEKGRKITERSFIIQINDKAGNWPSQVKIDHGPNDEFDLLEAFVTDRSGEVVRKLKKKDIVTKSDLSYGTFYQDGLEESFDLYWHEYPYQVHYSYRLIVNEFVVLSVWYPTWFTHLTTLKSSLTVELPLEYEVIIDADSLISFSDTTTENAKIFSWKYDIYKLPKEEVYSPSFDELAPSVHIIPKTFQYGVSGSNASWEELGTWIRTLNEGSEELPLSEIFIIDRLTKELTDKREIVRVLYEYLQDKTTYINVAIDVGGLKTYPASYVCTNKYGDCKALSNYMKSMLSYVGIPSNYTIINGGANDAFINPELPSQQFNHVILSVPLEGDTIWLENTDQSLPYNYMGTFTQDRYALSIDADGGKLVRTPKLDVEDVLERTKIIFSQDSSKAFVMDSYQLLKGRAFETYRHFQLKRKSNDVKTRIAKDLNIKGLELSEWDIQDSVRSNRHLNITAYGNCASPIRDVGKFKIINPLKIEMPDFEKPENRKLDVSINYPIHKVDTTYFPLANLESFEVQLPENIELSSEYGIYKTSFAIEANQIIACETFILESGRYPIETYESFYEFITAINSYKKTSAILLK